MKKVNWLLITFMLFFFGMANLASAAVPNFINYQGVLTDANDVPLEGTFDITVSIYDVDNGGTALWGETHAGVLLKKGVFNVKLGKVNVLTPAFDVPYWLGISINGAPELTPRMELASTATALVAQDVVNTNPTGTVIMFPVEVPPSGYIECDGSEVSRTTYAKLFAVLGTRYGAGDGSTTFNLPDMRGQFVRGWDHNSAVDPDRNLRSNRGDGVGGDNVGTLQGGQIQSHRHNIFPNVAGHTLGAGNYLHGAWYPMSYGNSYTGNNGGNETRPKNIYMMYCIKY